MLREVKKAIIIWYNTFQQLTEPGMDENIAAADAWEMEHAVSQERYEALKAVATERR